MRCINRMNQDESSESWIISYMDFMHHGQGKASSQCPPEQTSVLEMNKKNQVKMWKPCLGITRIYELCRKDRSFRYLWISIWEKPGMILSLLACLPPSTLVWILHKRSVEQSSAMRQQPSLVFHDGLHQVFSGFLWTLADWDGSMVQRLNNLNMPKPLRDAWIIGK